MQQKRIRLSKKKTFCKNYVLFFHSVKIKPILPNKQKNDLVQKLKFTKKITPLTLEMILRSCRLILNIKYMIDSCRVFLITRNLLQM